MNRLLGYLWILILILVLTITSSSFLLYSYITAPYSGEEIAEMYKNSVGRITTHFQVNDGKEERHKFLGSAFFCVMGQPIVRTAAHVVDVGETFTKKDDQEKDVVCKVIGSATYEFENIAGKKYNAKLLRINREKDIAELLIDIRPDEYIAAEMDYDQIHQQGAKVCSLTGYGSGKLSLFIPRRDRQ